MVKTKIWGLEVGVMLDYNTWVPHLTRCHLLQTHTGNYTGWHPKCAQFKNCHIYSQTQLFCYYVDTDTHNVIICYVILRTFCSKHSGLFLSEYGKKSWYLCLTSVVFIIRCSSSHHLTHIAWAGKQAGPGPGRGILTSLTQGIRCYLLWALSVLAS